MKKKLFITFLFSLVLLSTVPPVLAQDYSNGSAIGVPISEKGIKDGEILVVTTEGYKRATEPYSSALFGVVSLNAATYYQDEGRPNDTPVTTLGKVAVRVSTTNGPIKKGDFITSSKIPGVGQKATENGNVLGTAEENYTEKDPKKIAKIYVTLSPHFAQLTNNITQNVFSAARLGATAALQTPIGSLKYIIAGFIAILSFYFGFRFFAFTSRSGVEAVGRNPLASKVILLSVAINSLIAISIMLLGVALGYLILVL